MNAFELRSFMARHGLSGYRLAKLLGVDSGNVPRWLSGSQRMSRQTCQELKYLGFCLEKAPKKFFKELER